MNEERTPDLGRFWSRQPRENLLSIGWVREGFFGGHSTMMPIRYARVSTAEGRQVLDRRLDALREAGCERIFDDHGSGAAIKGFEVMPALRKVQARMFAIQGGIVGETRRGSSSAPSVSDRAL